jgi:carbon-monoxide dehydrogenase medium subunit
MGTAVGNLCVATPASDIACALFALGAKLTITSSADERTTPIEDFYIGVNQTALKPDEIVIGILLPNLPGGTGTAFQNLARTADDVAKVNAAVMLIITDNRCTDVKIALGSVATTVIRARKAEGSLKGREPEPELINEAAEAASEEVQPITDIRSTAEYRKEMSKLLVKRLLRKAVERAMAQSRARET